MLMRMLKPVLHTLSRDCFVPQIYLHQAKKDFKRSSQELFIIEFYGKRTLFFVGDDGDGNIKRRATSPW